MKKEGLFVKIIFWINCIAAFLLVISFILPYLPPKNFPNISLLSLAVSPLIILNILFGLYWLIRRSKWIFLSLSVLVISYFYFNPFFEFSSEKGSKDFDKTLSILSYNVRLFNAYEENQTKDVPKIISELLNTQQPDVICIQEFYRDDSVNFAAYPYQYIYFKYSKNKKGKLKENVLGHAILSKYPLINTGSFDFSGSSNNSIYADLVKDRDTIRVYNLHLSSMGILPTVSYLQEGDTDKLRRRMSNAFIGQQEQMVQILAHKDKSPYPVLLCGDFNNTQFSYVYRKIQTGMQDAYLQKGNGLGTTYLFDSYPMRIDYVFTSEQFEVLKFETIKKTFSDHYPVVATVGWPILEGKD